MRNFGWPGRADAPQLGDAALDAVLEGARIPADQPELRSLGGLVTALTAAPAADELAGEAVAMAAFRDRPRVSAPIRHTRRRPRLLSPLLSVKAAIAATAAIIGLGGVTAAAYAGALPSSIQKFAHDTIGAPLVTGHSPKAPTAPPSSSASAHANHPITQAVALCEVLAHGTPGQKLGVKKELAKLAGGASNISAYCAAILKAAPKHPMPFTTCLPLPKHGPTGLPSNAASIAGTKIPTSLPSCVPVPTGAPSPLPGGSIPTGLPTPTHSGRPSGPPTHPSGSPTSSPTPHGPKPSHS